MFLKKELPGTGKSILVGQLVCMRFNASPDEILEDLKSASPSLDFGITGGQHTVQAVRESATEFPGGPDAFFKANPNLRVFQAKIFGMGQLHRLNVIFERCLKEVPASAWFNGQERHFNAKENGVWELSPFDKIDVMWRGSFPSTEDAIILLRMEHNSTSTSEPTTWAQKLALGRSAYNSFAMVNDKETDDTVMLDKVKTQMEAPTATRAKQYLDIFKFPDPTFALVLKILEMDRRFELLDHKPKSGKKGPRIEKEVFTIQPLITLSKCEDMEDIHRALSEICEGSAYLNDLVKVTIPLLKVRLFSLKTCIENLKFSKQLKSSKTCIENPGFSEHLGNYFRTNPPYSCISGERFCGAQSPCLPKTPSSMH